MTSSPDIRFLDRTTPPHISTLIALSGLSALTMSIFLPSLNHMADAFGVDYAVMQLAVTAYLATTAVLQIFIGPIADRFGRRPVMIAALSLFTAVSIGAMVSTSFTFFIICRLLQASIATAMVLSRAIVRDLYPPEKSASQIGYVTMGMAIIPMVGPTIGGFLDEIWDWRASFFLLSLCGLAVLALVIADQGETLRGRGVRFADQVRAYPVLFRSQRFWGYVLCAAFGSGAFFALLGGASFVAGEIYGLSPLWTGIAIGTPAVGYAFGNFLSGRYSQRVGINRMALAGTLVATGGMALSVLLTLAGVVTPLAFFAPCVFLGMGNGILLPNATAGSLSVRPDLAATAAGLGGAIMIAGGAALAALSGAVLTAETGTLPLQWIMLACPAAGVAAILWVMARDRQLARV
jgi:MFS transporter, DHA1 family, multidrug resistance protein